MEYLEICTGDAPDASIIWLHGLGADGHDFAPVVEAMQPLPYIRFILPHAPVMPVTINGGYRMPAWYDILGSDIAARQDAAGIRASQTAIEGLLAQEQARGVAPERILLAGFSQGGAIALQTALRYPESLAGVLALSTYLPMHETVNVERSDANDGTPIFMAHGTFDGVIPLQTALASRDLLQTLGYRVDWHEYPMSHSVCEAEIDDIRTFILERLPPL